MYILFNGPKGYFMIAEFTIMVSSLLATAFVAKRFGPADTTDVPVIPIFQQAKIAAYNARVADDQDLLQHVDLKPKAYEIIDMMMETDSDWHTCKNTLAQIKEADYQLFTTSIELQKRGLLEQCDLTRAYNGS
jgi:hypothetical protein